MIFLVRFAPRLGDISTNLKMVETAVRRAIEKNASLIVFPELALSGYHLESLSADSAISAQAKELSALYELSKKVEIVLGAPLKQRASFFNTMLIFRNGRLQVYKKVYLPNYGMFNEARYFKAGDRLGFYESSLGKMGLLLCEDAWHLSMAYAISAAMPDFVLVPSAFSESAYYEKTNAADYLNWESRLVNYSVSLGVPFFYVNLLGTEEGVHFNGHAFMVNPTGKIDYGDSAIEDEIHYNMFDKKCLQLHAAATLGGPWQNESFSLNQSLFEQAKKIRENNA